MQMISEAVVRGVLEDVSKRDTAAPKPTVESQEAARRRLQNLEIQIGKQLAGGGHPNRKQRRQAAKLAREHGKVPA